MSRLKGSCGPFQMEWKEMPVGNSGSAELFIGGVLETIRYQKDSQGITIETSNGVFGYDCSGENDEAEGRILFRVKERNSENIFDQQCWKNESESLTASATSSKKKSLKIKSQMPGKILKVFVKTGDLVEKNQPLLTMEAMKMENEIRSTVAGVVELVSVTEGQAVETGAVLIQMT